MKKILILSRYKEDISWINSCFSEFETIYIFNKSTEGIYNIKCNNVIIVDLPNVGRETDTYLKFIINYYETIIKNGNEYSYIFSQAYPFDNSPHFLQKIKNCDLKTTIHLSNITSNEPIFAISRNDPTHPYGLPFINYYNHLFFKENLNLQSDTITFQCNGLWIVPCENLLFRKIEFYKYCLSLVKKNINPFEGYLFERLWQFIFDGQTLDWISHYDKIRQKYALGIYKNLRVE